MTLPPQIITMLVGAAPISELRGAIPLAIGVYKMPPWNAFFWAVLGNIIPIIFVLWLLESVSNYLSHRFYSFNRFFTWLFERTRKKNSRSFENWGSLALMIFVAIPLPLTGGWSGAVAAFVFGIPYKKSLTMISLGIILAGVIVTLVSVGVLSIGIF